MGAYTDNLTRRRKQKFAQTATRNINPNAERLIEAAIRRDSQIHAGFKSHAEIRRALGDEDPYMSRRSDQEGFLTNSGRFISRDEAVIVGLASGQLPPMWEDCSRMLLSSDIRW
jgi:hypothetical protein